MMYFAPKITFPLIRHFGYRNILEIGASMGQHSETLLSIPQVKLTIIDPCMDCELDKKFGQNDRVTMLRDCSLNVLPTLQQQYDCIFIDGDHNWYTVYNELKQIISHNLLKPGGTIFLHDVAWPYARRDMYYNLETIPQEYILPHAKKGVVRYKSSLIEQGGANFDLENALAEGGPRNGVLTAVEDFIKDHPEKFHFMIDQRQFGLGILIDQQQTNQAAIRHLKLKVLKNNFVAALTHQLKSIGERCGFKSILRFITA